MSEFTKGEWSVKHSETKDAFNVVGNALGGKYKIARCPYNKVRVDGQLSERYNGQEIKEAKANAQLIAHAPQILEAMQEFCDKVDKGVIRSERTYAKFKQLIQQATTI